MYFVIETNNNDNDMYIITLKWKTKYTTRS